MGDWRDEMIGRMLDVAFANAEPNDCERARLLFNLGIRGGTTRAQVDRIPVPALTGGR